MVGARFNGVLGFAFEWEEGGVIVVWWELAMYGFVVGCFVFPAAVRSILWVGGGMACGGGMRGCED